MSPGKKKILIFIISYKASFRILDVYKKIPFKNLYKYNVKILLSDDNSRDDTIKYAINIKKKEKNIFLNENKINIGYGAHIKKCLKFALTKKFDYAVMIHGDGQYDPRYIPSLLKKFSNNKNISAVTGSRILRGIKKVYQGGMPFYKLIGNILLTKSFNLLLNTSFTDTHTGLWAYDLESLKDNKFKLLTDSFNFDQEFRFMNVIKNRTIKEIPIQTKYGDERSQLHIKYAIKFFLNSIIYFFIKIRLFSLKKFR